MALRDLVRKLRVPATAALQRASSPRVSLPGGPPHLASRSSQTREAMRAVNRTRDVGLKGLGKVDKNEMSDFEKASIAIDNLPRVCALSAGLGVFLATSTWAFIFGAFDGSRRKYSA